MGGRKKLSRTAQPSLAEKMVTLAEELAAAHEALDFSLASLPKFERIIKKQRAQRDHLLEQWGAYLGESIRRASGVAASWVDFATASARNPSVAALEYGPDLAAILNAGSTCLFPQAKIVKFLDNGARDSLAAFAPVAADMLRPKPAVPVTREPVDPARLDRKGVAALDRFFAAPSLKTLEGLSFCTSLLRRQEIAFLLRERGALPTVFYDFLGAPPNGRGHKRVNAGNAAAQWIWLVVASGQCDPEATAEALKTRLGDANRYVRENAAYALGRILLRHRPEELGRTYEQGDDVVRLGLLKALRSLVSDVNMGYDHDQFTGIDWHTAMLESALAGPVEECSLALTTIHQITVKLALSIAPVVPALLKVLENGKPAQIETALDALTSHVWRVKHGRAEWTATMLETVNAAKRHARPLPGKSKTTKVQIAAQHTLSALCKLADQLPRGVRRKVLAACERVAGDKE